MMRPGLSLLGGTLLARPSLSASGDGISASTDGGVSTPPHVFARWERPSWKEVPRWTFAAAACAIFVYFFPILSGIRIPSETFRKWMWFSTWI